MSRRPAKPPDPIERTRRDPARLDAVRATGLVDTPVEEEFDRLTRLAAKLTGAPVTFVSLVGEDRDFYKSCFGFPEPLASQRELTGTTFCHYALVSDGPLVIDDTTAHPVYRNVPTVETLGVRAYLGVPLVLSSGKAIGSFCAIDFKPRQWTPLDIDVMRELAASTLREVELRIAVNALGEERRRLSVLLERIPAGVVFAEAPSGRIVMRNRQAVELIGDPRLLDLTSSEYGQWVGFREDGRRMAPNDWPIARALAGEVVQGEEVQYERADGGRIWLRIDAAPVTDDAGAVIGGVVAFYDIEREKKAVLENARLYREAQEANRAKDEFFAAVTHELRTPMTSIIGWTKMLTLPDLTPDDAREATDSIISSARVQAQLVDDLLDVSRIATGKLTLHRERLSLNDAVNDAVYASQPAAESKGVALTVETGKDAIMNADRARIRQIIGNLLSNAIKFTPEGGRVSVMSNALDGLALIVVRDTGRGIEPSLLPHIFERYRQAQSAELGGLGLGLTIVKHLVEMHNGDVRADSEGNGKGATFTVRLPIEPAST